MLGPELTSRKRTSPFTLRELTNLWIAHVTSHRIRARERLKKAIASSVAPTFVFNPIAAPNLTNSAGDGAWVQPLSLALHAARNLRESFADRYFPQQFKSLAFTQDEFDVVMDVFGDHLCKDHKYRSANAELPPSRKLRRQTLRCWRSAAK